ncbi:MAG: 6-phosphogluconolactonase [Anaerolineae bacterium]|nr:6-phosphogluconolactonase [Phycisphaerae bacterium]
MITPEIKVLPDPAEVAHEGARRFVELSEAAIELAGRFSVGLAGGSTPRAMYELLATPQYQTQVDWPNIDVFFGDERCVPPDDPQSNYHMAREALLSKVPIPGDNIYRMRGEADPNEAAKEYGQMLKEKFGDNGLDLIYLGMGGDGHTASLFPITAALRETKHRCVANHVPQLNTWRITLAAPFINRARDVIVMVASADKAKRLAEVLEGPRDPERLPIQLIQPVSGKMSWLVDAAAAGMDEA